jgi:peptide/nickel transport system ATP-binding protein/oligopeptide transport system ATP-binding protein
VTAPVLEVEDLRTWFDSERGLVRSVDGVSFTAQARETVAIVGESGSGKSVTSLSIMRLIAAPAGRIVGGAIRFRGRDGATRDLVAADDATMRSLRGNEISMIFQEPMTSLNPVYPVGDQIAEAIVLHRGLGKRAAWDAAVEMLALVGIPAPARRAKDYPHQMSGGMRQRVMIAMALACRPVLLIADEPTTALDVTIQAQILDLMRKLQAEIGMAILFITHNLGVVAEVADRVVVMYGGRVVESGPVARVFRRPLHPYTRGLMASVPGSPFRARDARGRLRLTAIPGNVPDPRRLPPGCAFAPRCSHATPACDAAVPALEAAAEGHDVRCIRWQELAP